MTDNDVIAEAKDFLHDCDRSARYHTARRSFFDKWHRWMMVAVLISGSSAVWVLSSERHEATMFIMLVPALIGAISVVWNLTDKARDHELLARRFYELARSINVQQADEENIEKWRTEILSIYEDEPAVYHALNAECGNAVSQALGFGTRQRVTKLQHMLRNWYRFSSKDFPLSMI